MSSTERYGEMTEKIYLSKATVKEITMQSNECWMCKYLLDNIVEDDYGSYISREQLTSEYGLEHLRKLIAATTDNVAFHIMDGDTHIMRTMPAQAFFDMMHDIFD